MSVPPTASTASFNEGNSCGKQAAADQDTARVRRRRGSVCCVGKNFARFMVRSTNPPPHLRDPHHGAPLSQRDSRNGFDKISSRLIGTDSYSSRSFLPRRSAEPAQFIGPNQTL